MPDWPIILLIVCLLIPGLVFILSMIRINSINTNFPLRKLQREDLYFLEEGVSGKSSNSFVSRLGGAFRCLNIVITRTELWVYVADFLPVMSPGHGIRIKIPLASLMPTKTEGNGQVIVQYKTEGGQLHRFCLRTKKPMGLIATLEDARRRGGDMTGLVIDERVLQANEELA